MSADRDVNRIVRSWMDEGVTALPDHLLDAVLDQIPATPQRRPSWLARRSSSMNTYLKFGLAATAVVAALVIGLQLIGSPNVVAPPTATPTPSAAAPSAADITLPLPSVTGSQLAAGTSYFLPDFPVGVAFTVADRWRACSESPVEQLLCYYPSGDFAGQLGFLIVTNVAVDPCSPGEVFPDPPVGPSVDDLVTAISSLEGFEVTSPVDTSVDGFSGKLLTVSASTDSGCDALAPWATEDRVIGGVLPGHTDVLRILDVDGDRIVITSPDPIYPYAAEFDAVLATVQLEP